VLSVAENPDLDGKTRVTAIQQLSARVNGADCLVIIHAPEQTELGKRFLIDSALTTIGRGQDNDIVLSSDCVSRKHSRIERQGTELTLIDLNSTNGVFINDGQRLKTTYRLRGGDQVMIGDIIFKFLSGSDIETQYHEIIFQMTITDGLTGVCNRKQLDNLLSSDLAHAQRHARPLSIVMLDIDHFKRINDQFGHLAGDTVLRSMAGILQKRLRTHDRLGRYGGEEFCLILPETPLDKAVQLAEELRALVASSEFSTDAHKVNVTLSLGVATYAPGMTATQLYQRADELLYAAKHAGRNQVKSC
jgi:two-component system, cell cycle response regulator